LRLRDELDRLHLVTLATQAGTVAQRGGSPAWAEAHRLAAWRDDFLEHGRNGLTPPRADRGDATDRRLEQAERKVGELTLENESLRASAEDSQVPYDCVRNVR
jgi:hypothetical protein